MVECFAGTPLIPKACGTRSCGCVFDNHHLDPIRLIACLSAPLQGCSERVDAAGVSECDGVIRSDMRREIRERRTDQKSMSVIA